MEDVLVFYMGLDFIRGTLFDSYGKEKAVIEKPVDLFVNEECVEQDPDQWLGLITEIIKEISAKDTDNAIGKMTVTYQAGTFVCVDKSGNKLMNAIMPCDRRARYQAEICEKKFGKHNEGLYVPWCHLIIPKIMWIKYNQPDIYKNIFKILTPDGFIAYKLCGETAIDTYSAAFLGYNLKTCLYNDKIINRLGLDTKSFSETKRPGECIGTISGVTRDDLGLKSDVKFIITSNCNSPVFFTIKGGLKGTIVYDGESSSISFIDNYIRIKREYGLIRMPFKDDKYIYDDLGSFEIHFLKLIKRFMKIGEFKCTDYSPGSNGLLILPFTMGDNVYNNYDTRGSIVGFNGNSLSDMITACYEAIGYTLKERIDRISDAGVLVDCINLICDIKDELFYQILSNITTKKVIISSANNSISRYAFIAAAGSETPIDEETLDIYPDRDICYKYKYLYDLYRSAYSSLDDIFKYRRKVLRKIT